MTKVKICGITNIEDALVAVEAGADLLGFIFYEPSPRYVSPEVVRQIISEVSNQKSVIRSQKPEAVEQKTDPPKLKIPAFVGVFVNASPETVARTLDFCQLDAAQLHGEEPPEMVAQFQGRAYKALRPQAQEEAEILIQKYLPSSSCPPYSLLPTPYFLLDAYHPTLYGGTGHVADWSLAVSLARRYPLLLAGSLTPDNVAEAVRVVQPWGVDVSSGVEREKGKKDHLKVRAFVKAAKSIKSDSPNRDDTKDKK